MTYVIAENGRERQHRKIFRKMLKATDGPVRIVSPYITDQDLLFGWKNRTIRLLTSLHPMDIVSGATSLKTLRYLIEAGVDCRCFSEGPRLHAKVYLFGKEYAVVTSANLTRNALDNNIEVGVQLTGKSVHELTAWFDYFWTSAGKIDKTILSKWQHETKGLRPEYKLLRMKVEAKQDLPNGASTFGRARKELFGIMDKPMHFFVCNTNRRWSAQAEKSMFKKGYAAVWEDFRYPSHMERVVPNDLVLMFAKGVGIVGIGRAKGKYEVLKSNDRRRIVSANEIDSPEWRIPVDWLAWVEDDTDACYYPIPNVSFLDVSGENYKKLRKAVKKHFIGP